MDSLPGGVYMETVSLLCRGGRVEWGMPLGLIANGGSVGFRVFEGSGYWRLLVEERREDAVLIAYTPLNPVEFLEFMMVKPAPRSDCRPSDYSFMVTCRPRLVEARGGVARFACEDARVAWGRPAPYTRAYGCLVELAVLASKARAGVVGCEAFEYARWLGWCVERSAPGLAEYRSAAAMALQAVEEALRGRCKGLQDLQRG